MRGRESDRTFYAQPGGGEEPFAPDDIEGLEAWYKADAIEGLADGAAITTWVDSSGNSRDLTQSNAAKRPTYKTNIQNGQPVVRWAASREMETSAFSVAAPFTAFAVGNFPSSAAFGGFVDINGTTSFGIDKLVDTPEVGQTAYWLELVNFNDLQPLYGEVDHVDEFVIATYISNGASSEVYGDGLLENSGDVTATDIESLFMYFVGDWPEVILYSGVLSTTNLNLVGNHLADKYALDWTDI